MSTPGFAGSVTAAADRAMALIREDIAAGIVPREVGSFTDLHDYLDANEYVPYGLRFGNPVLALVDARIRSGELRR